MSLLKHEKHKLSVWGFFVLSFIGFFGCFLDLGGFLFVGFFLFLCCFFFFLLLFYFFSKGQTGQPECS